MKHFERHCFNCFVFPLLCARHQDSTSELVPTEILVLPNHTQTVRCLEKECQTLSFCCQHDKEICLTDSGFKTRAMKLDTFQKLPKFVHRVVLHSANCVIADVDTSRVSHEMRSRGILRWWAAAWQLHHLVGSSWFPAAAGYPSATKLVGETGTIIQCCQKAGWKAFQPPSPS